MRSPIVRQPGPWSVSAFRLLTFGQFTSTIGDYCYAVVLPWLVLSHHGSAVALGVVLSSYGIPRALLTVPGGALADRWGPRRVMLGSDALRCALTTALTLLTAAHGSSLEMVAPLSAALGGCSAVFLPASLTLMPSVVQPSFLTSANALNTTFLQTGSMLGPVIGGLLVATWGPVPAFAVDAASYVVSATCLMLIGRGIAPRTVVPPSIGLWTLLRRERLLRVALLVSVAANFALTGTIEVTLPALAHARYGALGFGLVLACVAVMGAMGALFVAWTGERFVRATLIAVAFQVAAVAIAVAPLVGGLPGLAVSMSVFGLALGFDNAVWGTLIQRWAPPELLGRVWGVLTLAPVCSFPISTLTAGFLTRHLGPAPVFPLAGALLSLSYLFGLSRREFRQLGQPPPQSQPQSKPNSEPPPEPDLATATAGPDAQAAAGPIRSQRLPAMSVKTATRP